MRTLLAKLLTVMALMGLLFSLASCCCAGGSDSDNNDDTKILGNPHGEGTGGGT